MDKIKIQIDRDIAKTLNRMKKSGESYSDVIRRRLFLITSEDVIEATDEAYSRYNTLIEQEMKDVLRSISDGRQDMTIRHLESLGQTMKDFEHFLKAACGSPLPDNVEKILKDRKSQIKRLKKIN